jgi:ribosomal protein L37AE/L43A
MIDTIVCKHCNIAKDISLFPKDKRASNGVWSKCKDCGNKHRRDRYRNDDEYHQTVLKRQRDYIADGYYAKGFCSNASQINDTYVIQAIRRNTNLTREDIPPELIESWRELLKIKRLKKQITNEFKQQ